jgi:hypothetical protein
LTAEIVVANKWGIAIAADSAVTAERMYKGQRREKIYHSANKLFTLSKWAPVGVMFYNTVTLGGTPWETIVKMARTALGKTRFATLTEYADFLFSHLEQNVVLFPLDSVKHIVNINILRVLYPISQESRSIGEFQQALDGRIAQLEAIAFVPGFNADIERQILVEYAGEIDAEIRMCVKPSWRGRVRRRIRRLVQLLLSRKERLPGYSGIVICGFGESEVFPTVVDYYTDIVVCGKVRYWQNDVKSITRSNASLVLPFADVEVIRTILDGINPKYMQKQFSEAITAIFGISHTIIDQIGELDETQKKLYKEQSGKAMINAFSEFYKTMDAYRKSEYVEPIESTLQMLPVSELAIVAETLLNASQIHKKVNPDSETVGGPVDVAVISKGDGFIWVKRKHYFDPKLNVAFAQKYLDD